MGLRISTCLPATVASVFIMTNITQADKISKRCTVSNRRSQEIWESFLGDIKSGRHKHIQQWCCWSACCFQSKKNWKKQVQQFHHCVHERIKNIRPKVRRRRSKPIDSSYWVVKIIQHPPNQTSSCKKQMQFAVYFPDCTLLAKAEDQTWMMFFLMKFMHIHLFWLQKVEIRPAKANQISWLIYLIVSHQGKTGRTSPK